MPLCEDWCTVEDVIGDGSSGGEGCGPCSVGETDDPLDPVVVADAIAVASEILYGLTGEVYSGLCPQTVRPCARRCRPDGRIGRSRPVWDSPTTWNGSLCYCPGSSPCSCTRLHRVKLPAWPVTSVVEVLIDGVALDPAAYRVDEQRWLTRVDGEAWPVCQDLELPATEEGTFAVTFTSGEEVTPGGRANAAKFACELSRAWCGIECELPSRVSAITRQGTSVSFESVGTIIAEGRTGIASVDEWIRAVNGPNGPQVPLLIANPDDFPPLAYRPGG